MSRKIWSNLSFDDAQRKATSYDIFGEEMPHKWARGGSFRYTCACRIPHTYMLLLYVTVNSEEMNWKTAHMTHGGGEERLSGENPSYSSLW